MSSTEFIEQLRRELPKLLREHPEVRHVVLDIILEASPTRQEFMVMLEEMRSAREDDNRRAEALRADMNARFEAIDRRFEAMDCRFADVLDVLRSNGQKLRDLDLHISSLGGRVGHNLESMVKSVVEEFAGQSFPSAERLVLWDENGEVFGVPKAEVEFDLNVHNGSDYLVEVKSHLKITDVLIFHRKVKFAESKMGRSFVPLIIALSMDPKAEPQMQALGIKYRIGAGGVVATSSPY